MFVPPKVRDERLSICRDCKFYKPKTGSCGTLVIGNTVIEENAVTHYKAKIKLCGCRMKWKTKYKFARCPAGKWHEYIGEPTEGMTSAQYRELAAAKTLEIKNFVISLHSKAQVTSQEVRQLSLYYIEVTGYKGYGLQTTCGACVREMINTLTKAINHQE